MFCFYAFRKKLNYKINLRKGKMKNQFRKIILIVAILALLVIKSFGQIDLGVKAGINISSQLETGVSVSGDDLIVGLNVGGIVRYHVNEWLAIKSDISYIQKGRRYRNPFETSTTIVPDRFHYLIIPLKAEISTGERVGLDKGQKLFFAAGPYYGFLLNAERKDNGTNTSLNGTTENYDYGLSLDLGFEFPVKNHSVTFGANYEIGLSKFAEYDNELRNTTISFNVGFIF
jgi:hypothetical protein